MPSISSRKASSLRPRTPQARVEWTLGSFVMDGLQALDTTPSSLLVNPKMCLLMAEKFWVQRKGENPLHEKAQHLRRHHGRGAPQPAPHVAARRHDRAPPTSMRFVGQASLQQAIRTGAIKISATSVGSFTNGQLVHHRQHRLTQNESGDVQRRHGTDHMRPSRPPPPPLQTHGGRFGPSRTRPRPLLPHRGRTADRCAASHLRCDA